MAGFINASEISNIKSVFQSLHDTFKRKIIIHKTAKNEILISSKINNNNPLFNVNSSGKKTVQNTPVYLETYARIYYKTDQIKELFDGGDNTAYLSVPISDGEIKIVLDEQAYALLANVEKVEFDGIKCRTKSDTAVKGIFGPQFYHVYLSREQ